MASPSRAGYSIAALVALAAVTIGVAWGITAYVDGRDRVEGFARTEIPGRVTVAAPAGISVNGDVPRSGVLAVGPSAARSSLPSIAGAVALVLLGLGAAATLAVVTAARRSRP